ncbi:MAG: hypothetical protein M1828_006878 [Chrysothrix sp. TS-e1954]|nr:MAG: hypothetical protein M1828_006878 [Chrysothrix sp. TS-e1954]
MQFVTLALAAAAAVSQGVTGLAIEKRAMTAQQMVDAINAITQVSRDLLPVVANIQTGDTAFAKRQDNPFQPVVDGFNQEIRTLQDDITAMDGTQPFSAADAAPVCDAFSRFVTVDQQLLNIVIGKSGLLEGIFLGPVASVLRSYEGVVDTFAFGVIDSVPSCQTAATQNKSNLDDILGKAVCAYTPGGSLGLDLFC